MKTKYNLGTLFGLNLSAVPSAFISTILLWLVLSGIAIGLLNLSLVEAIVAALIAVALHWLSETAHQLGHAFVARRVGYPMRGIRYWGLLSFSLYPRDEPALPGAIHIRRALGGPVTSFLVTLVAAAIVFAMNVAGLRGVVWYLALFCLLENLLVFTLGALLPLGFNDGGTLVKWWGKR